MNPKTQKIIAFCNIILCLIIFIDYYLPGQIMKIQELDSFYTTTVKIRKSIRPSYVDRKILSLTNGETFRIGKMPNGDFPKGQKIQIVRSLFSGNIKEVIILGNTNKVECVSIVSYIFTQICLLLSGLISLLKLYYEKKILYILLVMSMMFTFIFAIGYFFN